MARFKNPTTRTLKDLAGRRGVVHVRMVKEINLRINTIGIHNPYRIEYHGPEYLTIEVRAICSPEYGSCRAPSFWQFFVKAREKESTTQLVERVLRSKAKKVPIDENDIHP